jgi:hypothetical protein
MKIQELLLEFYDERNTFGHGSSCNPNDYYDIDKLKAVSRQLANKTINPHWHALKLKQVIDYMESTCDQGYVDTLTLNDMFPDAPEIVYYITRNIIKLTSDGKPNPHYRPRTKNK